MIFKGIDTSKNLLKLIDDNYISSESEIEECKIAGQEVITAPLGFVEDSKEAVLIQLPEDYNLVEEVQDEEEDCAVRILQDVHDYAAADVENSREEPSVTSEVLDDALAEQMRLQKLLERQQRILKASKLIPDLAS